MATYYEDRYMQRVLTNLKRREVAGFVLREVGPEAAQAGVF
jgi:hypothetical protein